jgi:hypothetical protein
MLGDPVSNLSCEHLKLHEFLQLPVLVFSVQGYLTQLAVGTITLNLAAFRANNSAKAWRNC